MSDQVDTQKEVEEGSAYQMEQRLLERKNVYAENDAQKRDHRHSYSAYALALSLDVHKKIVISPEQRYHMIAKAAYFRAKLQGFRGSLAQDWVEAEAEIDKMLKGNEQELPEPHHDSTLHGHE